MKDRIDPLFLFITGCWIYEYILQLQNFLSRNEDSSEAFKTRHRKDQNASRKGKITGKPATGGVIIIFQNHHLREHVTLVRP